MNAPTITELPGYRIVRELGRGGMATVYLAIQESFGREVAVKVMSPALLTDPSFGERFLREARIVAQLSHPNIVQVYDVGVHGNHHYLAMEYLPEGELNDRLARGLEVAEVFDVTTDVARALHFAHRKGYIHRDIKPENILFREEGSAVLSDFGIARAVDSSTQMTRLGSVIGTPHYMSPEQAEGKELDGRSDIYSLGVVFYKMLTGQVPFEADSAVAIGIRHITDPVPTLPPHLTVFQPILDKFLAKHRDQRFQDGRAVMDALAAVRKSGKLPRTALKTEVIGTAEIAAVRRSAEQMALRGGTEAAAHTELATRINVNPGDRPGTGIATGTMVSQRASPWPWLAAGILLAGAAAGGFWYWQQVMGSSPAGLGAVADTTATQPTASPKAAAPTPAAPAQGSAPATELAQQQADSLAELRARANNLALAEPIDLPALAGVWRQIQRLEPTAADASKGLATLALTARLAVEDALQQDDLDQAGSLLAAANEALPGQNLLAEAAQRLRSRESVNTVLDRADAYLAANALMEPAGASAFALYQQALDRDPDNARAKAGLEQIAVAYANLAKGALERNDLDAAVTWLERGGLANRDQRDLLAVREQVNQRRSQQDRHASLLARADVLFAQGAVDSPDGANAAALYRQVLADDPKSAAAARGLAKVDAVLAARAKQQAEAAALLAEATSLADSGYLSAPGPRTALSVLAEARALAQGLPELNRSLDQLADRIAERLAAVAADAAAAGMNAAATNYLALALDLQPDRAQWQVLAGQLANSTPVATATATTGNNSFAQDTATSAAATAPQASPAPSQVTNLSSAIEVLVASTEPLELLPRIAPILEPGFNRLYVGFRHNSMQPGSVLSAVLYDGGRAVELRQVPVIISSATGVKKFQVDRPVEGFTRGSYAIDLLLDGQVLASLDFRVGD